MAPSIVNRFIAIFLAGTLWSAAGRANNGGEPIGTPAAAHTQTDGTTAVAPTQQVQTFDAFTSEFSSLVKAGNWEGLADLTEFPLTIRGELDDEGSVEINRKRFVKFIGGFFQEEVYLTINDELVTSTYRELMIKPVDKPELDGDTAELYGFHFIRKNQHWKLNRIVTYAHIVERVAQTGHSD